MSIDSTTEDTDTIQFEVSPRGSNWQWILRNEQDILAHSLETYESVNRTFGAIDQLWSILENGLYGGYAGFEIVEQDDGWGWHLVTGERKEGKRLAMGSTLRKTEDAVTDEINRFRDVAPTAQIRIRHPPEEQPVTDGFEVGRVGRPLQSLKSIFGRGKRHRDALKEADIQIAVSGIRGKSSTVKRLDDVFNRRGYDTLTKITGDHPTLIRNGEIVPIERYSPRVTLYENIELFQRLGSSTFESPAPDVAIVENQAITEYTMRMVNERFFDPDIVVLCNVRQDHNDTLGADRQRIARAFGRSIPSGAHVVSGEQHPIIHEYLREEIEKRGATISQVDIPEHHRGLISAETVYALNEVLERLDEPALSQERITEYLDHAQPTWSIIDGQRVFNAAKTNDIESTEAIRRALVENDEQILPFVYLRSDRRGRTASFAEYMNILADRGCIEHAHVGGDHRRAFIDALDVPCESHSPDADPEVVLDELLADGRPIIFMGNTVAPFMREMERVLAERAEAMEVVGDGLDPTRTDVEKPAGRAREFDQAELETIDTETGQFEVYEDRAGEYRWNLRHDNGNILGDGSEGYASRSNARRAIGRVFDYIGPADYLWFDPVGFEVYRDQADEFRWRLVHRNGNILGDSGESYTRRHDASRAVSRLRDGTDGLDFEVYEDNADEHRWRVRGGNQQILADSGEGYASRTGAEDAVSRVQEYAPEADVLDIGRAAFEIYEDNAGEYRWRLRHRNGNILMDSGEGYTDRSSARDSIESVKRNVPNPELQA